MKLFKEIKSGVIEKNTFSRRIFFGSASYIVVGILMILAAVFIFTDFSPVMPQSSNSGSSLIDSESSGVLVGAGNTGTKIDKSKKSKGGKKDKAAQNKSAKTKNPPKKTVTPADSSAKPNRIKNISRDGDWLAFYVELHNYSYPIDIVIKNGLGYVVSQVHSGPPKPADSMYNVYLANIPNGVYLITVSGPGLTLNEKFTLAKD